MIKKRNSLKLTIGWKSRVYLTPEGEVALTPENVFILTPQKPWPVGSFLFRLTCLL